MPLSCLLLVVAGATVTPPPAPARDARAPVAEAATAARKARSQGDLEAARRLYLEALRLDPASGVLALELGETCLDAGDAAAAERVLSRLVAAAPDRAPPRRALARALLALGRPEAALEQARAAAEIEPKSLDGMVLLGFSMVASGRPEDAVAVFRRALARRPKDRDAHGGLAMAYAALSDPRAAAEFETVLAQKAEARYHYQFAEYLWRVGDPDRGNLQMEKALDASRGDGVLLEAYGMQLFDQGKFPECARRLKEARAAGRNDYDLISTLGSAELENSHFDEAERILREAVAAAPDRPEARHRLGVLLLLAGKPAEARQELARLVELDTSAQPRMDLARAEEALGNLDAAEAAYRRALEISPDLARARYLYGVLLSRRGRTEESRRELALYQAAYDREQAERQKQSSAKAEIAMGWVLLRQRKFENALARFQRHPDHADALRGEAEAFSALGRRREALAALERALVLKPDDRAIAWRLREERQKGGA